MRVEARVAALAAAGLQGHGDRAFIHFGNCHQFFAELLAIWSLGACAIPIDPRFTPFEIETLVSWSRPKCSSWLETPDGALLKRLEELRVHVIEVPRGIVPPLRGGVPSRGFGLDDDALILFTSGTTGQPKGVVHTHRSLRARWMSLRTPSASTRSARTLCLLPTHFGHGLICNCLFPWLSGQHLFIAAAVQGRTSSCSSAPCSTSTGSRSSRRCRRVWRLALKTAAPAASRHAGAGLLRLGAALRAPLEGDPAVDRRAEVWNAYGITETGSWLAGTTVGAASPREDGLIGVAWGGVLRVLQRRERGAPSSIRTQECRPGEIGPRLGQHAGADARLSGPRRSHRAGGVRRLVLHRRHRHPRRARLAVPARPRARGDQQGRHEGLSGRHRRGGRALPRDTRRVLLRVCEDALLGEDVGVAVVLEQRDEDTLRGL